MTRIADNTAIISGKHVRMAAQPFVFAEKHHAGEAVVSVRRSGGQITEIHIRCACGAELILDCDYDT